MHGAIDDWSPRVDKLDGILISGKNHADTAERITEDIKAITKRFVIQKIIPPLKHNSNLTNFSISARKLYVYQSKFISHYTYFIESFKVLHLIVLKFLIKNFKMWSIYLRDLQYLILRKKVPQYHILLPNLKQTYDFLKHEL